MKKRILLVNKFYYNRGGDCVVAMNLERLLRDNEHEVAFFAMQYPENFQSEFSKYFASQVEFSGGAAYKLKAAMRTLGLGDIKKSFEKILQDFKPDVVHLQNIHSYISPVVAKLAKRHGCKVVWTLHDYKLLCPSYSCLRNNEPCELCYTDKSQVLRTRCMKGSLAASALAYVEAKLWNKSSLEKYTDTFICPSAFMALKMSNGGFSAEKLNVVCNFVDPTKLEQFGKAPTNDRHNYYCYIGRLSQEKGVATLLEAASQLPYELKIAGDGPLFNELRDKYANCPNVKFLGRLNHQEVSQLLINAKASVIPSEWYENNPLGVIESLCAGTPVIGARNGGIPELINDNNGIAFTAKNVEQLKESISFAMTKDWDYNKIKSEAIDKFSPQTALAKLLKIYE